MKCQYQHGCVRMAVDNEANLCAEHYDMLVPERFMPIGVNMEWRMVCDHYGEDGHQQHQHQQNCR